MGICKDCIDYSRELYFNRRYKPEEFIWGKVNSLVWIVGLNPKYRHGYETQTKTDLERYFDTNEKNRPYYQDFNKVSPILFEMLGKDNGVAHTDIVKCFSDKFPKRGKVIRNCTLYFERQLQGLKPKLLICNGSPVCKVVRTMIEPLEEQDTFYRGRYDNCDITVILAGFVGRIDDYAKRRLGLEIERIMRELSIV